MAAMPWHCHFLSVPIFLSLHPTLQLLNMKHLSVNCYDLATRATMDKKAYYKVNHATKTTTTTTSHVIRLYDKLLFTIPDLLLSQSGIPLYIQYV